MGSLQCRHAGNISISGDRPLYRLSSVSLMQKLLAEGNSAWVPRTPTPIFKLPRGVHVQGSDMNRQVLQQDQR